MRKAVFGLAVLSLVVLDSGLSGCASGTANMHQDLASKTYLTVVGQDVDMEKIVSVNRWAHEHGARVIWINYPQKVQAGDDSHGH